MKKSIIGAVLALSCLPARAQPPLFAGYNGPEYALESRVNQDRQITEVEKTFRNEFPVWGYFGASLNEFEKPFYGIGPSIQTGRLHTLPTVEGYDGSFTGISGYSTADLPRKWYLDLVPHLDNEFRYSGTEFTLHRGVKGVSVGVSSSATNGEFGDINLQAGKYWKGCNLTGNVNPKTKTGKLSFQKNFK